MLSTCASLQVILRWGWLYTKHDVPPDINTHWDIASSKKPPPLLNTHTHIMVIVEGINCQLGDLNPLVCGYVIPPLTNRVVYKIAYLYIPDSWKLHYVSNLISYL